MNLTAARWTTIQEPISRLCEGRLAGTGGRRFNDVVVAETMLARLVGVSGDGSEPAALVAPQGQLAFAAGGILGWHRRRAAEIDLQLVKDWNSFARAQPFWVRERSAAT